MAASSPPPQSLSAGGGALIGLFLDTDLGTHLALDAAADSTIRGLKSQVSVEHAAAFPDFGTVSVKSIRVLRKGAMYHLSDSMTVRSAFANVKGGYFLHVKMAAAEKDTQYCREEDTGKSSDKLPPILEGREAAAIWVNVHAHDVHPSSSSQRNIERNSRAPCLATDVRTIFVPAIDKSESYKQGNKHMDQNEEVYVNSTSVANINGLKNQSNMTLVGKEVHIREEDLMHSVRDREGNKQMGTREETFGELHVLDDPPQEKGRKKARVTGSFDQLVVDPIRERRDVENFDKVPLETNTDSREVLSNTSFQQDVDGNVKHALIQLENPIITGKNKKGKKGQIVTSKDVSAREMSEPSTGEMEVPKAISEDLLHEIQGLRGDDASNGEITRGDKTKVIPPDMFLLSSQLNSGSQGAKHVQLGTDAQGSSDLAADQSNFDLVQEGSGNPVYGDISVSTCKVVASGKSAEGANDGGHDQCAVDTSNMEKDSKSEDVLETLDNISQAKSCKQSKKASSVGLTSMDIAEAKDQCGYGKKAGKSDNISTQQEIVNDSYKQQTASNVQHGDCNVIENPNGDARRKKRRRHHRESSKDDPTQDVAKSFGVIMNASSVQNASSRSLDANPITLGNREETADEKDQCMHEKVAEKVIVSMQVVGVNDPSNVQQGDSDVIKNPNGDRKRKKKEKRHLESSKDDPIQDVTKPSVLITNGSSVQNISADPPNAEQTTPGTIGESAVSDRGKVDETVDVATTYVMNEVLADVRCTYNLSKVWNVDPLLAQTKGGASAALPPSALQSDPPIGSHSHKSEGKPVEILSTILDPSHSSGGLPVEISDVKDVLTENTVVPANGRTKSTKRQRNTVSLKHVPTDSGKAMQSLDEHASHVPADDLKGTNCTKAELFQGGSAINAPASTGQIIQKKSKKSSKTRTPKLEEVDHSTHGHEIQFANDSQNKHVTDIGETHNNERTAGALVESAADHKDDTPVTRDKPNNARKGRKKSSKTELQSQDTNVEHGSDADLMNSRAQQGAVMPEGSSVAVEPNDHVAVHPDNEKINFIDHFSPSATNGPSDSAKNNDETIREVKGKKKSKRIADTKSQYAGSVEPNDLPESDVHTDKASLVAHFGTGNVGVASVSENMNRELEDRNVKKAKGKRKSKTKPDLLKPESLNPMGGNHDTDNYTQDLMHSDAQKGSMEHGNPNENNDRVIRNGGMLQQETEDATHYSTLEKKPDQRMSKEQRSSNSRTSHRAKDIKHDGSIDGRISTNPNSKSNPVQSVPMSPQASNESAYGTPDDNQFIVAVRKVPRKMFDQVKDKSKKGATKRGTGTIFGDTISHHA